MLNYRFSYSVAACFGGGMTPILAMHLLKKPYQSYSLSLLIFSIGYICLLGLISLHSKRNLLINWN